MASIPATRDLFYPEPEIEVPFQGTTARRIGRDLEADILVTQSGTIVARLGTDEWFVNSSVEQYRQTLALVGRAREQLAATPVRQAGSPLEDLEPALRRLDGLAFERARSYWASIVEQIRDEQF